MAELLYGSVNEGVTVECPICLGDFGAECKQHPTSGDAVFLDCGACGTFFMSGTAMAALQNIEEHNEGIPSVTRASMSHRIATASRSKHPPLLTADWISSTFEDTALPSVGQQVRNIIRLIGDQYQEDGMGLEQRHSLMTLVGCPNLHSLNNLVDQLIDRNLLTRQFGAALFLTLDGWEAYESEQKGLSTGKFGFIAMKYNSGALETLVQDSIKPRLSSDLGFKIIDLRDVAQAGIIDNIMRAQIRDAAFVLADLTHDNPGAYWEAGYAEGLGKPVIYLCESKKFEDAKTHFDTNHCTTVIWSSGAEEEFLNDLIATVRRSINLFPSV